MTSSFLPESFDYSASSALETPLWEIPMAWGQLLNLRQSQRSAGSSDSHSTPGLVSARQVPDADGSDWRTSGGAPSLVGRTDGLIPHILASRQGSTRRLAQSSAAKRHTKPAPTKWPWGIRISMKERRASHCSWPDGWRRNGLFKLRLPMTASGFKEPFMCRSRTP